MSHTSHAWITIFELETNALTNAASIRSHTQVVHDVHGSVRMVHAYVCVPCVCECECV